MEKAKIVPFVMLFLFYVGSLGVDYYSFQYAPDGQVEMHRAAMAGKKSEIQGLKKKLDDAESFAKGLEAKKDELRTQYKKLIGYKDVLSESLDVPSLIKIIVTETKRIQIKVEKIEPGKRNAKDYYVEQEFKLNVRGNYYQLVLLAQRIAQLQRILRIESFTMKPSGMGGARSGAQLDAQLSIRAYQYAPSREDSLAGVEK